MGSPGPALSMAAWRFSASNSALLCLKATARWQMRRGDMDPEELEPRKKAPAPPRARQPVDRGAEGLHRPDGSRDRAGEGQDRGQAGPSQRRGRAVQARLTIPPAARHPGARGPIHPQTLSDSSPSVHRAVTPPSRGIPKLPCGTQPSYGSAEVATSLSLLSRSRSLRRRRFERRRRFSSSSSDSYSSSSDSYLTRRGRRSYRFALGKSDNEASKNGRGPPRRWAERPSVF